MVNETKNTKINRLGFINKYMHDVIIELDDAYNYIYVSPSHKSRFGIDRDDLKTLNFFEFVHPDFHDMLEESFKAITHNDAEKTVEYKYWHNDRNWVWVESIMNKYVNCDKSIHILIDCREITDRKRAEERLKKSEEKYKSLFENMTDGFAIHEIILDINGNPVDYRYLNVNPAFERLTGLDRDYIIGKTIREVLPNTEDYWFEIYADVAKHGIPTRFVNYSKELDKHFDVKAYSPKRGLFAVLFNDVSEKIKVEGLENEIKISKASAEFKQKFLANMSHEIRTPLTGVIGIINMLSRSQLSEEQMMWVDMLKQASENLHETINLILDYSKLEAGKITIYKSILKTTTIFDKALDYFYSINKNKLSMHTYIDANLPKWIKVDVQKLNQILNNLISNSVKFTDNGAITLHAQRADVESNDIIIRIEVSDTGIGIKDSAKKHLFKPFSQIDNNISQYIEGTGLGLTICKEMASALGGDIGVYDNSPVGSTFWFTFIVDIPTKDEVLNHIKINPNVDEIMDKNMDLNILLVEDKKTIQLVAKSTLQYMGHNVFIAENGKQALEMFVPGKFDLILMDVQMPIMGGVETVSILRKKYNKLPPIIGLSANALEGDREKYMSLGMDEYITKPILIKELKEVIDRLLN